MPKQRKSRSSQRTTVPFTMAQSNGRANSADVVQKTQYAQMPTETLRLLSSQRRLVQSGPRQQLIARLQANDSQDSTSPPTGPATILDQQLASMIASIVEQKLATLNAVSNSLSSSTSGVVQPSAQQSAQQHLPGLCLNHTVQKDSRGVLGTSFRFGPEILDNIQYGGSSVVKTDSQRSRFIAREA